MDQESARRGTTVYLCEKVNVVNLKWNFDTSFLLSVLFLIKSSEVFAEEGRASVFNEI